MLLAVAGVCLGAGLLLSGGAEAAAVPASARALGAEQTPFLDAATEDFPVALVRGGKGLPAGGWEAARDEAALRIGRVVQAIGDRSVAIGGDVSGSVIITGDHALTSQ